MKITVSKFAGFCSGAKRAYEMTIENAKTNKNLHILGDLLHNQDIIKKIKSLGIKKIGSVEDVTNGFLIVTAHGDRKEIFDKAKNKGLNIINTTCPKVIKIQQLVKKFYNDGRPIIIFGDKNHKEVQGINGWCDNKALIISNEKDLDRVDFKKLSGAILVSQTTQKSAVFKRITKIIQDKIQNIRIFDTICDATKNRQDEIKKIAKNNDAVIVVGGKKSANSKKLFEIAQSINPKSFFIENAEELKLNNFSGLKSVGITAGASTPDWAIKEVYNKLKK